MPWILDWMMMMTTWISCLEAAPFPRLPMLWVPSVALVILVVVVFRLLQMLLVGVDLPLPMLWEAGKALVAEAFRLPPALLVVVAAFRLLPTLWGLGSCLMRTTCLGMMSLLAYSECWSMLPLELWVFAYI